MKKTAILFVLCACVFLLGQATFAEDLPNVYIEEMLTAPPAPGQPAFNGIIRSYIAGKKLKKVSPGGNEEIIYRGDLKKVYILNPMRKVYIEMPMDQMRTITEKSLNMYVPTKDGVPQIPDELYVKTGNTKKIGQWNAYEVEVKAGQVMPDTQTTTTMWISKETGFDHNFFVSLFKLTMGDEVSPHLKKLFEKMTNIDGYPVQTVTTTSYMNQNYTTSITVLKIERKKAFEDSVFEIPEGYSKVEAPPMEAAPPQ